MWNNQKLVGGLALIVAGVAIAGKGLLDQRTNLANKPSMSSNAAVQLNSFGSSRLAPATRSIQDIRVGERVLAHNPEIADEERGVLCAEPDWSNHYRLQVLMLKPDGSELNMELLRSKDWVLSQMIWMTSEPPLSFQTEEERQNGESPASFTDSDLAVSDYPPEPLLSPLHFLFRRLVETGNAIEISGSHPGALLVEMDLPELAIVGPAAVINIQPAPRVQAGQGRVVTATFHHSSGDVIDLTIGDKSDHETIGTTNNHPFWSVDRRDYVQAGTLEIGERVQTHAGDTRRVISKLPRPGPEAVYNIEVHGEHVYFVGQAGILTHNARNYVRNEHGLPVNKNDFDEWWDNLTYLGAKRIQKRIQRETGKDILGDKFRDGGKHEWLMVSRAYEFKRMGYKAKDIRRLTSLTVDMHPRGSVATKGWTHKSALRDQVDSNLAHNDLLRRINALAPRIGKLKNPKAAYNRQLAQWAVQWMKNGVDDLPIGLGGKKPPL